MEIDVSNGLLSEARYLVSPHSDERPDTMPIDLLVIHGITLPPGEFSGDAVEKFFCGKLDASAHPYFATLASLKVSAHLFIRRTGEILQFVPFSKRAWHAGESHFQGRSRCNDFSIGIELEGTDDVPYEKAQYAALAQVTKLLMTAYPGIRREHIVGHSDIAPHRKTDPGPAFDWAYFDCVLSA